MDLISIIEKKTALALYLGEPKYCARAGRNEIENENVIHEVTTYLTLWKRTLHYLTADYCIHKKHYMVAIPRNFLKAIGRRNVKLKLVHTVRSNEFF
jgi:hypothetical protein